MAYQAFQAAYSRVGPYNNVAMAGTPANTGWGGVPLATAHAEGYGQGIQFTQVSSDSSGYLVRFELRLVPYAISDQIVYIPDQYYIDTTGNYNYNILVQYSTNNQASWNDFPQEVAFSHPPLAPLLYRNGWQSTASISNWAKEYRLPLNTTHVSIKLSADISLVDDRNVYTIDQVLDAFLPFGVRGSDGGEFISCDGTGGALQIRNADNGSWENVEKMPYSSQGVANMGTGQIRDANNGTWRGQDKV